MDYNQFECTDHVVSLRYLLTSNNARQYRYQCVKCGEVVGKGSIKYSELTEQERKTAPKFDEILLQEKRDEKWKLRKAVADAEYTERSIAWWTEYSVYMQTPEWKDRSKRVIDRDNRRCTARLPGCTAIAEQAHHLTYDHFKNEPLFDLTAVCKHCHDEITRMDRERKQR